MGAVVREGRKSQQPHPRISVTFPFPENRIDGRIPHLHLHIGI